MRLVQAILRGIVVGLFLVALFPGHAVAASSATVTVTVQIQAPAETLPELPAVLHGALQHAIKFGATEQAQHHSVAFQSVIPTGHATMNVLRQS